MEKRECCLNRRVHPEFRGQVAREGIILGMTQDAHELLQKALALPENERAELAGLIASLDATASAS